MAESHWQSKRPLGHTLGSRYAGLRRLNPSETQAFKSFPDLATRVRWLRSSTKMGRPPAALEQTFRVVAIAEHAILDNGRLMVLELAGTPPGPQGFVWIEYEDVALSTGGEFRFRRIFYLAQGR